MLSPHDEEALKLLAGALRRDAGGKAAVRIEDLGDLLTLPALTSVDAAAAPTQAQYNALRADVRNVHGALRAVANILQGRLR